MSYGELTQEEQAEIEKVRALENATLFKTAAEVAELYKELGEVEVSACALGYACRYKGLEHVKALVENGASFNVENSTDMYRKYQCWGTNYAVGLLDFNKALGRSYFIHSGELDTRITNLLNADNGTTKLVLPLAERLEILRYLYENRERVCLETDELLFFALIARNKEVVAELKKLGAAFSEKIIKTLTESRRSFMWDEYCGMVGGFEKEELFEFYRDILAEIGEGTRLRYTEGIYYATLRRLPETDVFEFLMEHFDCAKMNKTQILKDFVLKESIDCLAAAEKYGWLSQPRRRDELIKYASEHEKTEATAWLLDFKNRTADLTAEQEKAEKKMMRELNADPNSVSELSKIWSYKKREDGTLVITSYKGNKEEVSVPEKIGKEPVTAIGAYAFSPHAPRVREAQAANRKKIRKITLPDSVKFIEEYAFYMCKRLEEINIPDGVTEICKDTFSYSNLKSVTLPNSVQVIGEAAFASCDKLEKINIPQGVPEIQAYAFSHCKNLKEVEIPDSVTVLRTWAFINCEKLSKVILHEGLEEIGSKAFSGCVSLEELEIPASVNKIKNYKYKGEKYKGEPPVTPFEKIPNLTVTVTPKTCAERFCKRNELPYKVKES